VSLDKSLKRKDMLVRRRNVLTRSERIERLVEDERFDAQKDSVFALPKVKPLVAVVAPSKGPAEEKKPAEGEAVAEGAEAAEGAKAPERAKGPERGKAPERAGAAERGAKKSKG
jgi:small basic protein (TIGR04137 family)